MLSATVHNGINGFTASVAASQTVESFPSLTETALSLVMPDLGNLEAGISYSDFVDIFVGASTVDPSVDLSADPSYVPFVTSSFDVGAEFRNEALVELGALLPDTTPITTDIPVSTSEISTLPYASLTLKQLRSLNASLSFQSEPLPKIGADDRIQVLQAREAGNLAVQNFSLAA